MLADHRCGIEHAFKGYLFFNATGPSSRSGEPAVRDGDQLVHYNGASSASFSSFDSSTEAFCFEPSSSSDEKPMAGPVDLLAGAMTLVSIALQQSGLAIVQGQRPTRASAIISLVNVTALGFSFGKVPTPFSLLMLFVMVDLFIFYEFIRSKRRPVHMDTGANILRQGTRPLGLC